MKRIYLIGIGTGNLEHLTVQAINTIRKVDVFFILEKESEKNRELIQLRREILKRYRLDGKYRIKSVKIPERKKGGKDLELYKDRVDTWRKEKAEILADLIKNEMTYEEKGAILIWGDPSLYDGHIEILNYILKMKWADFQCEVIPGITSLQELTAKHKIPLNFIGESINITTGRRLKELLAKDIKNTAVLLDNYLTYKNLADSDLHIYWGCYLGTKKEVLISGPLKDVVDEIVRKRTELKKVNGWIMETYILRKEDKDG